jgi:hypothetical protein
MLNPKCNAPWCENDESAIVDPRPESGLCKNHFDMNGCNAGTRHAKNTAALTPMTEMSSRSISGRESHNMYFGEWDDCKFVFESMTSASLGLLLGINERSDPVHASRAAAIAAFVAATRAS